MRSSARRHLLPLVLVLAALSGACQSQRVQTPPPPASPDVWAVVDGREIRRDAIEKVYRRTMEPNQAASEEESLTAKLTLLDQAIVEDVILAKARELKIVLPDSDIDNAFNEQKKGIADD